MADRLVYILALAALGFIRLLPLSVCFVLGQAVGALLWLILPGYRRLARENLTVAFGREMSPAAIRELTFKHFTTLGANVASAIKIPTLSQKEIERIAHIENLDAIRKNIAKDRPVLLAINHIGNWELYAQLVFQVPEAHFGTVYQALHNKLVDDLVNRDRRRLGVQTFDRKAGFQGALALLREPGILGVLVDQHAGHSGVWTPFFNRLCSTSPLSATLAIRTNAAVIPAAIYTTGFARWRVVLSPEVPWSANNPEQLTLYINKALEKQIRVSPADWFWVHNRWKTPLPNFLINEAKRGIYQPPTEPDPSPFRIVVRSPNWLGEAVMAIPAVRAFKLGRPDSRVSILCPQKLAGLWQRVGDVDEVIGIESGESLFATAAKLRGQFEAAVLLPNSLRSALEVWLAGIRRRVGFAGHSRSLLLDQVIVPRKKNATTPLHHADRYWHIAVRCGAEAMPPTVSLWKPAGKERVIGICPGAEYGSAKRWPAYKFRMLVQQVNEQVDCSWVVLGTAADSPLAREISNGLPNVTDLTGKTTLGELMDLLGKLSGLLTNDTGTMHLADFIGTPLVALFGSTEPALTGPRSPRSRVIRQKVECSPCFLRECPIDFRCMEEISMDQVVAAVIEFIKKRPASGK
ncbi:MAG: lipopolysaccharide heptosyltransferase II [Spartobacteria bacterium]